MSIQEHGNKSLNLFGKNACGEYVVPIMTTVCLSGEDIDDIVGIALDGAISYWCSEANVVGEYLGKYTSEQISRGGTLILQDAEEDTQYELDLEKFLKGFQMYLTQYSIPIDDHHPDLGDFDACAADSVIQLAIFGEIIYG